MKTRLATISKRFDFSASHQLDGLHPSHPCSRLHGHNYEVVVELTGHTDPVVGFVLDYRALTPFKTFLDEKVDHRHLNDLLMWNPTAENLAGWLGEELNAILYETQPDAMRRVTEIRVSVSETPKTTATITRRSDPFDAEDLAETRDQQLTPFLVDADRYRWNFDTDGTATPVRDEADQAATDAAARLLERAKNYLADEEGR